MRGFACRSTVEEAWAWIDQQLPMTGRWPDEEVSIWDSSGRVLARDVVSSIDVPGFRRAMMDGYAVRADETLGAKAYQPLPFPVVATVFPGAESISSMEPGQVIRIMTGAPMPVGSDAVLPAEQVESQGDRILAMGDVVAGKHVGAIGEDVRQGSTVLRSGRVLRPQDLGVLASIGCSTVPVVRKPTVRILVTGNELLPAGSVPKSHRIVDANGPMLAALVARDGGQPMTPSIVADDEELLRAAIEETADIVLVSGGSSVGLEDHAPRLLSKHGCLAIHGIAMRPSSPTGMGTLGESLVFLLPGNPVSCLCAYDFFAGRAIRGLAGRHREWPYRSVRATLRRKLVSMIGRVDYARVRLVDGMAEPVAISGASILTSTTEADGFVVIPADLEGHASNSPVDVWLYDGL